MTEMRRLIFLFLVVVTASSCTPDGQKETEIIGRCAEEACVTSIINVIANPSEYNGKKITVRGYFASSGTLALYPTETNYRIGDFPSSIGFRIPMSQQKEWVDSGFLYKYVEVIGVIATSSLGSDGRNFANFVSVHSMAPIRMIEKKRTTMILEWALNF